MRNLKRWMLYLALTFLFHGHCRAEEWLADYDLALQKARAENKAVLLDFTGSDWCQWCMKLKSEVFDQPEFGSYADQHLILVEVDFPRRWVLSRAQQEANDQLAQKYGVHGFPTVVVLNSDGERIGTTGYHEGGAKPFIESIDRMSRMRPSNAPPNSSANSRPPNAHAPELVQAPNNSVRYEQLALKGISGAANRRMALINNETLMVGETAKIKVKDTKIAVTCKEIRANSVLLIVEGKPLELKLAHF